MKRLIVLFAVLIAIPAHAGMFDAAYWPQFNGGKTRALPVTSVNVDLSQDMFYSLYCAAVAKERTMFGNYTKSQIALKTAYIQSSVPATTWHTQAVNKATPFLQISGCSGWMRRQ